jgi:hypothetical protein
MMAGDAMSHARGMCMDLFHRLDGQVAMHNSTVLIRDLPFC